MKKKEKAYIIKRTVVEEYGVIATSRAEAIQKSTSSSFGPASVTVIKETCRPADR